VRDAVSSAISAEHSKVSAQLKQACDGARRSQVESLNQILRRLRATSEEQVLELAARGCAPYVEQLVVLVFESNQARCAASHDLSTEGITDGVLSFETASAQAVVAAIESRDPVISLGTDVEISPALARAFRRTLQSDQKVYLFPIVARHSVVAMVIASGVQISAPIELLCEAAGMRLEGTASGVALTHHAVVLPHHADDAGPVQSVLGVPASETSGPRRWEDLSADDQKLHLQAQRIARVRVAEMRVYHENELKRGVAGGDIYGALQREIDTARDVFLQAFLSKSPTMVDYLHLEILRSLAHDNDQLLGHGYPGPMV
jgi:hypothetical protein